MTYFIDGIQHCVTVVDKWIFEINNLFTLPLTRDEIDCCVTNDDKAKKVNGYKGVLKYSMFFSTDRSICFVKKWKDRNNAWCYKYDIKMKMYSKLITVIN